MEHLKFTEHTCEYEVRKCEEKAQRFFDAHQEVYNALSKAHAEHWDKVIKERGERSNC